MIRVIPLALLLVAAHPLPTALAGTAIGTTLVGNPGNLPDQQLGGFGAVAYSYRIGLYEVTNSQYAEFLNKKAKSDPLDLYNTGMGDDSRGGIMRTGATGTYTYSLKNQMDHKPVNFVSFYDALRFTNWLNNGQGESSTEIGAYSLTGESPIPTNGTNVTRNAGAAWFLTSENEWYKAAYHQSAKVGGDGDDYWLYPTASNSTPLRALADSNGDRVNPGAGVVNYASAEWNGEIVNPTTVGSAGPRSKSYYGTYDQAGNVGEWNESPLFDEGEFRNVRVGDFGTTAAKILASNFRSGNDATKESFNIGFRVASILPFVDGDMNWDDVVDGTDYTIWADHY